MKMPLLRRTGALSLALLMLGCQASGDAHETGEAHEKGHDEDHHEEGQNEEGHHEDHDDDRVVLAPGAAARVTIVTMPVAQRDLQAEISTTAEVGYDEDHLAHVTPRISGRVHEVRASLGQDVKAGEVLAIVDSTELGRSKADYLQARARATLARETLTREARLAADQIAAQSELAAARAAQAEAESTLYTAQETLRLYGLSAAQIEAVRPGDARAALYELRAPVDGRVVDKHLTRGEIVDPKDPLFTVADLRRVWIWIDVYERDLARVHAGDAAEVRTDAFPERVFQGRVSYVGDRVETATRVVRSRIEVDNAEGILRPGMFARVRLTAAPKADAAAGTPTLVVPVGAVQRSGDGFVAFVKIAENTYVRRVLRLGRRASDYVEVIDGLSVGEPVVSVGGFILKSEAAKASMGGGHEH